MTAQQLKNSILQMAVQGKLVPQDSNDEPASVLLERIRKEKEQLIKEGKIKKEKNPSVIFRGADNLPYEKIGNNEPVCIADDVPFDIPDSWEWVRLSALTSKEIKRGKSPKYCDSSDINVFAQKCNVKAGGIDISLAKFLDKNAFLNYPQEEYLRDGDVVINSTGNGTLGRIGKFHDSDRISSNIIVPDSHVTVIRFMEYMVQEYLYYALKYYQPYLESLGEGSTNQTELKPTIIAELFIPVPPVTEQKRIAEIISSVLPHISAYDKSNNKLTKLQSDFPEQLKKSILQQAVMGKLVPQDESDEPASVLLERIRAEKQALIKEGKIKKDKNESVIYKRDNSHYELVGGVERCIDDELPFEIPEGWCWIRLGALLQVNPRNNIDDNTMVGFIPMPLIKDGFRNEHSYDNKMWKDVKSGFTHFANKDVVVAKITPCFQNRKSAVICGLPNEYGAGTTELHVFRDNTGLICMEYILYLCKTHAFIEEGVKNFTGTAGQQRIGKEFITNYLVPFPPFSEQQRIVDKINELFPIISTL